MSYPATLKRASKPASRLGLRPDLSSLVPVLITPWGDASKLRDRRLKPGPGVPSEDVARNQRERLYAAMVAKVEEKGFEAVAVADVLSLSGVSRTTFYELFEDKRDCFVATVGAAVDLTLEVAAGRIRERRDGMPVGRHLLETFLELIASQPAVSRMCFVESYAAGPGALSEMWRAVAGFQELGQDAAEELPEQRDLPPEMLSPLIGSIYLIVHSRLYRREEAVLPELAPGLWDWLLTHRAPPGPLRPRRKQAQPTDGAPSADPEERIIRALAAAIAEHGYPATTIAEIAERAAVSQSTFYATFKGRKEALLTALDSASARLLAAMLPAARRGEDWAEAMRLAIAAMGRFGTSYPDLAALLAVGVYSAGPAGLVRRDELTDGLLGLFDGSVDGAPEDRSIAAEASAYAIYNLMYDQIQKSGPESLPEIVPLATYIALLPFAGAERAYAVAAG